MEEKVQRLIQEAYQMGVNDIHILPWMDKYQIYYRMNGKLQTISQHSSEWGQQVIAHFKYLANMDIGEKRRPQTGSAIFQLAQTTVELRFSTIANFELKESLVIRILKQSYQDTQNFASYFPQDLQHIRPLVQRKSGLLLFSGPVGSGKTTLIYHCLRERMKCESMQVITMEDPVEIVEPAFLQTQVNERANISYELLIKSSLRHHPDVLIIGEIRDEETARMAVRGALTGHLMIATIHAKDCLGVIARLQELQVSNEQLRQTLIGIVSQRLLPIYCPLCLGQCSRYCEHSQSFKRGALMEILDGPQLHKYFEQDVVQLETMNQKLRKVWAYGYINNEIYHHFEIV